MILTVSAPPRHSVRPGLVIGYAREGGSCSSTLRPPSPCSTSKRRWARSPIQSSTNLTSGTSCALGLWPLQSYERFTGSFHVRRHPIPFKCVIRPRSEAKMKLVRDAMAGLHFLQYCAPLLEKPHSRISWRFSCLLSLEPCVLYLERQCYFSDTESRVNKRAW
jgi:hypothetical protein